jgi:hypothetical protein
MGNVMANQHIVEITIIWPDDKWEDDVTENEYLANCFLGVADHFFENPIKNKEERRTLTNRLGRNYAEIHISPCRSVS